MGYTQENWEMRIAGRTDLSSQVVHLTRSSTIDGEKRGPVDVLTKILLEGCIRGSTTDSGFIVGDVAATCFLDSPTYMVSQNIWAEQEFRKVVPDARIRYMGVGLMFRKPYVYQRGGRPVIYESTERAKSMLPEEEWWRIVKLDLFDEGNFIDWTHEREWRVPGSFEFELEEVTVLLPNKFGYDRFLTKCKEHEDEVDILGSIKGMVSLGAIFL